jgi:hypothetical protein
MSNAHLRIVTCQTPPQRLLDRAPVDLSGRGSILPFIFQIAWFWTLTSHNINYDAISYVGIARHLLDGDLSTRLQFKLE